MVREAEESEVLSNEGSHIRNGAIGAKERENESGGDSPQRRVSLSPKSPPNPKIDASLRSDVASPGGGANCRPLLCAAPPLVAIVRCLVGNQGRALALRRRWCAPPPSFAALRHCSWNALRSSMPRPSTAGVCLAHWPFATLRRVCLWRLSLICAAMPPFKDIFQKYLDWEGEDCLEKEKERVYQYLHSSSEEKSYSQRGFLQDTINLSKFLTYIITGRDFEQDKLQRRRQELIQTTLGSNCTSMDDEAVLQGGG
ncbi:hypothetical protein Scep_025722 [Stephania cephalantha]|uniref:Uncharacterized protein n=1 Tax=Stephania cephalantha TaxID=152367 RepID=A0AAP0ER23_9MAGN